MNKTAVSAVLMAMLFSVAGIANAGEGDERWDKGTTIMMSENTAWLLAHARQHLVGLLSEKAVLTSIIASEERKLNEAIDEMIDQKRSGGLLQGRAQKIQQKEAALESKRKKLFALQKKIVSSEYMVKDLENNQLPR